MTQKIIDLLAKLPENLKTDIGLYIALGLTLVVFIVGLIMSLASSGDLSKFKTCAAIAIKGNTPQSINAGMQRMPVKVKKLYKRAMVTGAKPSDVVNIDAAVNTPYNNSAVAKLPATVLIATAIAMGAGVGTAAVFAGSFTAVSGVVILLTAILGGLLALISSAIAKSAYKSAVKSYDALMDVLDAMRKNGGTVGASAPQAEEEESKVIHSKSDFDGPSSITVEIDDGAEKEAEPVQPEQQTYEPVYEQPEAYTPPVYEQPEQAQYVPPVEQEVQPVYEQQAQAVIIEQPAMSEAEIRAKAREEALAAARAEQAERAKAQQAARANAQSAAAQAQGGATTAQQASRAAAAQRLEELKAQREAQLKAQREAQAHAQAQAKAQSAAKPSVSAEDVIARIEKINQEGATLPVMKEVAMLLQQERAKPENKTPEQQKKLNEALSKLLKAMSAANKK